MNPFKNNVGTLNEILFENRNQNYGAYVIRKSYNSTVFKSLGITTGLFVLGFFALSLLVNTKNEIPDVTDPNTPPDITTVYQAKKLVPATPEAPKHTASSKPAIQNIIGNKIVDSTKSIITPINIDLTTIGTGTTSSISTISGTGTLNVIVEPTNTLTIGGGIEMGPDVLPFMPGLSKFLTENLNYPNDARENRISGKVAVNFIVDEQGKIIETKIIHSIGFGCDEEALRVIKLMPKWKPGLLHGKPVKVSFNQVITFQLN